MKIVYLFLLLTGSLPLLLSVSRKYFLINQGKNWPGARAYCQNTHTDLAIIDNPENMKKFQSDPQIQQLASSAWIGLSIDVNSWRWSFRNEPLGTLTNWDPQEPNNFGGNQECGAITNVSMFDRDCANKNPFLCLDDRTGTESYFYITGAKTWLEAQRYCRQYHTDLISIKNRTDYLLLFSPLTKYTWIGLYRDSWRWVDKSNFSSVSWIPGQPDNYHKHETCAYITNGMAGDALCSSVKPFICYGEITGKKHLLKLKVKLDEQMKDSAVQLIILEQIKRKMKDYGIAENITVKWREP